MDRDLRVRENQVYFAEEPPEVKFYNPDSVPTHLYSSSSLEFKPSVHHVHHWYTPIIKTIRTIFYKIWDKLSNWFSFIPKRTTTQDWVDGHKSKLKQHTAEKIKKIEGSDAYKNDPLAVVAKLTAERYPNFEYDHSFHFGEDDVLSHFRNKVGLREPGIVHPPLTDAEKAVQEEFNKKLIEAHVQRIEGLDSYKMGPKHYLDDLILKQQQCGAEMADPTLDAVISCLKDKHLIQNVIHFQKRLPAYQKDPLAFAQRLVTKMKERLANGKNNEMLDAVALYFKREQNIPDDSSNAIAST